jgi:hypothetical protein
MKSLGKLFLAAGLVVTGLCTAKAQTSLKDDKADKAAEVQRLIQNKDYVFEATKEGKMPTGYHKVDIAVDKDTLLAFLPGHMKFDTRDYAYSTWQGKNGNWEVMLKPKTGMSDVKKIKMDISSQGMAMVEVDRSHGGPLSLKGYIKQEDY